MDKTRRQITKIARAAGKYTAGTLRKQGVGAVEAECLRAVRKNEGTSQEAIGEQLNADKAAVTRMIDSLVKKGYLVREKDPGNRRKNRIFSTEKALNAKFDEAGAESLFYAWLLEGVPQAKLGPFLEVLDLIAEKSHAELAAGFPGVRAYAATAPNDLPQELVAYHRARREAARRKRLSAGQDRPGEANTGEADASEMILT